MLSVSGTQQSDLVIHILLLLLLLLLLLSRFRHVRLCATDSVDSAPQMAAHQAPPSLGFSRHEYWSGLLFPSPDVHQQMDG